MTDTDGLRRALQDADLPPAAGDLVARAARRGRQDFETCATRRDAFRFSCHLFSLPPRYRPSRSAGDAAFFTWSSQAV